MTGVNVKAVYSHVILLCAEKLCNAGYVRQGSSLRKVAGRNVALIEFQKSSKSKVEAILFTINLGIVCGPLLEGNESLKGVGIVNAHVRQRIGMLLPDRPDKWWSIDPKTDAGLLIEEVAGLIVREAVPYIDRYLSDDELIALWSSGRSPGLTETQRLKYLAKLKAAKGFVK